MKRTTAMLSGLLLAGAIATPAVAGHAGQDRNPSDPVRTYTYDLNEVADNSPGSPEGTVRLTALPNGKIQVKVAATGVTPDAPHAQHIHSTEDGGDLDGGICPTIDADGNFDRPEDGLIDTVEGVPTYGSVRQSLTTTGDTSPASGLEVARFPVADEHGVLEYERTFTPTDARVYEDLGLVEVVIHGIDLDGSGDYTDAVLDRRSSLDPDLPLDATIPVLCGGPQG